MREGPAPARSAGSHSWVGRCCWRRAWFRYKMHVPRPSGDRATPWGGASAPAPPPQALQPRVLMAPTHRQRGAESEACVAEMTRGTSDTLSGRAARTHQSARAGVTVHFAITKMPVHFGLFNACANIFQKTSFYLHIKTFPLCFVSNKFQNVYLHNVIFLAFSL